MWQVFAVWLLIALVIYLIVEVPCYSKSSFRNKSPLGYYYDTETLSFSTKNDLNIGVKEIIRMFKSEGRLFTVDQLSKLPHHVIINILENDDEKDIIKRKVKLIVMLEPTYGQAVLASRMPVGKISAAERQLMFGILKKYFETLGTPVSRPLNYWPTKLLVKTFQTWTMPRPEDFWK